MKIYKNQKDLKDAWWLASTALDILRKTLIDNANCSEEVEEAYYKLLNATNKWHDEIERLPF